LKKTLYTNSEKKSYVYKQKRTNNTLKKCNTYINARLYTLSLNTKPPSSNSAFSLFAKKKRAKKRKRSVSFSFAFKLLLSLLKLKKHVFLKLKNKHTASPKTKEQPSKTAKKDQKRKV
jgi:hypothetical protein